MRLCVIIVILLSNFLNAHEPRGVLAVSSAGGNFLSWKAETGKIYNVYRNKLADYEKINITPVTCSSYLDRAVVTGHRYKYTVTCIENSKEVRSKVVSCVYNNKPSYVYKNIYYIPGESAMIKVGDFNADGDPDFLILSLQDTVHVLGYMNDGTKVFDIDMLEKDALLRIPVTIFDLDNDGKDELIGVRKDPSIDDYFLYVIDPNPSNSKTKVIARSWVPSSKYPNDPESIRYKTIAIAYLDGMHPYILYATGHQADQYRCVQAFRLQNNELTQIWSYFELPHQGIASSHQFEIADLDGDGKDEAFLGAYVYDLNGRRKGYFGGPYSHVDGVVVDEIIPGIPGPEVFYYVEGGAGGIHVFDRSSRRIWFDLDDCPQCRHAHTGFVADIIQDSPGSELFVRYKKPSSGMVCPLLYSATGRQLGSYEKIFAPVDWDGKGAKEIIYNNHICQFEGLTPKRRNSNIFIPESASVFIQDIAGDRREEIVTFSRYLNYLKMTIFTNTETANLPAVARSRKYIQDRRWAGH